MNFSEEHDQYQEIEHKFSPRMAKRIERYNVKDDDIKELLFTTSIKDLCELSDKVIMEYLPEDYYDISELTKIVDIAAQGFVRKYLTDKQKWCLASFSLFYLQSGKAVN